MKLTRLSSMNHAFWSSAARFPTVACAETAQTLASAELAESSLTCSPAQSCTPGTQVVLPLLRRSAVNRLRTGVVVFAAIAVATGVLLGFVGWPQPHRTLEFSGLILAAILSSVFAMQRSTTKDWATMPPSFIIDFASLLLFGPNAAVLVATAGTVARARGLTVLTSASTNPLEFGGRHGRDTSGGHRPPGARWDAGPFCVAGEGFPIAVAVVAYCIVKSALVEIIVPLAMRQPVNRSWPKAFSGLSELLHRGEPRGGAR